MEVARYLVSTVPALTGPTGGYCLRLALGACSTCEPGSVSGGIWGALLFRLELGAGAEGARLGSPIHQRLSSARRATSLGVLLFCMLLLNGT